MSVKQEKNKRKITKDGRSWKFRCYYTDIYGNRKQYESKLFFTRNEAIDAEAEFLTKVKTNDNIKEGLNITFEEVYNQWINYKIRQLKSTTSYRLKKNLNKNILEFFKDYKLHSIRINIINAWYDFLDKTGNSTRYQNALIGYLKEILNYARINYKFDEKIILNIQKIKEETIPNKIKDSEWNFWTYDEFKTFIEVVDEPLYFYIFNFLYFTGLRFGEMTALTWNDIDLKNKYVSVYKTLTNKLGNGSYKILSPKTKNSIRKVDLDDELVHLLQKHLSEEEKMYKFNTNMFVFGNIKYISSTQFSRKLNIYINKAKVKKITPHGFRHSHVSLLIHLGCDRLDVAERIGDTIEMVDSTYYHMFPEKKKRTINTINNLKKQ